VLGTAGSSPPFFDCKRLKKIGVGTTMDISERFFVAAVTAFLLVLLGVGLLSPVS